MAGAEGCAVWSVPAAQIVFRADSEMEARSIEVSPLKGANGAAFPAENIHLRRVAYIHLSVRKKDYPDPLPR
ncbi:MAG: hypothetical protein IT210_25760 [Armatimonadetes bacterium]|nr:hypothetical protein [Armatimonadota bacterium]